MRVPPHLDRIDLAILAVLQDEGRITNAALAERVGLSASPCLSRVRRLEAAGVVRGYGARLDLGRVGAGLTVFTEVTLAAHGGEDFARFEAGARAVPEVVECHLVSGGYDYLLKFACPDVAAYQRCVKGMLAGDLGIARYFSTIVIKSPMPGRGAALSVPAR